MDDNENNSPEDLELAGDDSGEGTRVRKNSFYSAETAPSLEAVRPLQGLEELLPGIDRTPFPKLHLHTLSSKRKVSSMPFAALLPQIGEVAALDQCREMLGARLRLLQNTAPGSDDVVKAMAAEEGMLNQALQWLTTGSDELDSVGITPRRDYTDEELTSLYELARMYYEMGYYGPAERLFAGLVVVDFARTPARLGLGIVKLERAQYEDAANQLRLAIRDGVSPLEAKLALVAVFLSRGEKRRAQSMLADLRAEVESNAAFDDEARMLWRAFSKRCA